VRKRLGPNLHLVQYRLHGGTLMNTVATVESVRFKQGAPNSGTPDELDELFAQCTPPVRDMLRYISRERHWVLHDRDPVTNWTKGRVTLLGDAAHPTLQYLGTSS
jgi:2-polyprenyl-6-methoxyphenol hydroxylase-like FAD-dependent oxidoreductase